MWNSYYRFGNVVLMIESQLEIKESRRFAAFRIDAARHDFKIRIKADTILPAPPEYEKIQKGVCCWTKDNQKCSVRYMNGMKGMVPFSYTCENQQYALQIYKEDVIKYLDMRLVFEGFDFFCLLNRKKALTLHASYINYQGKAILFSGISGIGKTTQAKLWETYRNAEIINGDRALIQKKDRRFYAHGISYAGTSKICQNVSLPLETIIVLKKAKENKIFQMRGKDSLRALLLQCSFCETNSEDVRAVIAVLTELLNEVPVYMLECTADQKAVETLEEIL